MPRAVWKYPLVAAPGAVEMIAIPKPGRILRAAKQGNWIMLWAIVDPDEEKQDRLFMTLPTGGEIPEGWEWIDTLGDGPYIWHVFEGRFPPT